MFVIIGNRAYGVLTDELHLHGPVLVAAMFCLGSISILCPVGIGMRPGVESDYVHLLAVHLDGSPSGTVRNYQVGFFAYDLCNVTDRILGRDHLGINIPMTSSEFTHPDDAAALKTLESIPVLPAVVKKVMDIGIEQLTYGTNMASKILLSPTQLPKLYHILPPVCQRLGIREPGFYLEMNPMPNAYAFGDTYTAITITSGLVEMLTEDVLTAVVAHECGHILCRHMLYHTMAATSGLAADP